MAAARRLTTAGLALRIGFALALVLATFNPSGVSFAHWAPGAIGANAPVVALAGVTLLILWAIYVRATLRALGPFGLALAAAFFVALLWALADAGLLSLERGDALQWAALTGMGAILGMGLSWSHIRAMLSGQADVDDVAD